MTKRLILALAALLAVGTPVTALGSDATDPGALAVGPKQPAVGFSGTLTTYSTYHVAAIESEAVREHCLAPACLSYDIDVSGGPRGSLTIAALYTTPREGDLSLEVFAPDGSTRFIGSRAGSPEYAWDLSMTDSNRRSVTYQRPADGVYTVRVRGHSRYQSGIEVAFSAVAFRSFHKPPARTGDAELDYVLCPTPPEVFDYPKPAPAAGVVNDPLFPKQWNLQQIKAPAAWQRGFTGEGVTIAFIDTGADVDHPEFAGRIDPGYVAIPTVPPICGLPAYDDQGHGTLVASVAAAGADDGHGIAGVAPRAQILPIKACYDDTACPTDQSMVDAVRYAIRRGADVINLSVASHPQATLAESDLLMWEDLLAEAWEAGIVLIAAAGNGSEPVCAFPANSANVLCVASTDAEGRPSEYSAHPNGDDLGSGVRAPGGSYVPLVTGDCFSNILAAAWPRAPYQYCSIGELAYDAPLGTSVAAPHVAGLAAMLVQAGLSHEQVVERIRQTASGGGKSDPVMGYGLIDADAATQGLAPRRGPGKRRAA